MRTIDADALIRALEVIQYNDIDDLSRTEDLIDNAPTVIIDEWISVDATLPKYTGLYLISIDALVTVANFDGSVFRDRNSAPIAVDAWQPLPKSYKNAEY